MQGCKGDPHVIPPASADDVGHTRWAFGGDGGLVESGGSWGGGGKEKVTCLY